jgi:hypothetical protein
MMGWGRMAVWESMVRFGVGIVAGFILLDRTSSFHVALPVLCFEHPRQGRQGK